MPLTLRRTATHPPIGVYLLAAEDRYRATLHRLLTRMDGYIPVGDAWSIRTGIAEIAEHQPDVALIAARLQDGSGLDAVRAVRELPLHVHVVVHDCSPERQAEALEAGACGFAAKATPVSQLLTLARAAASGRSFACRARIPELTMRPIRASA